MTKAERLSRKRFRVCSWNFVSASERGAVVERLAYDFDVLCQQQTRTRPEKPLQLKASWSSRSMGARNGDCNPQGPTKYPPAPTHQSVGHPPTPTHLQPLTSLWDTHPSTSLWGTHPQVCGAHTYTHQSVGHPPTSLWDTHPHPPVCGTPTHTHQSVGHPPTPWPTSLWDTHPNAFQRLWSSHSTSLTKTNSLFAEWR